MNFSLLALSFIVASASALDCGANITSNTMLTEDLVCDCRGADLGNALNVIGPAELDLNGFSVDCGNSTYDEAETSSCIFVEGRNARILNGNVENCNFGITVEGEGYSNINNVTVTNTGNDAILIKSSYNAVTDCTVTNGGLGPDGDNNGDGIDLEITTEYNRIIGNTVDMAGDDGIDNDGSFNMILNNIINNTKFEDGITTRGVSNSIQGNYIYNSGEDGIDARLDDDEVDPSMFRGCCHQIFDNTIIKTGERGMRIRVNSTFIKGNVVQEAGEQGIRLNNDDDLNLGNDCKVFDNVVESGMERGIEVEGTGNFIEGNTVTNNGEEGIRIEVEGNKVFNNVATGNGEVDFEDTTADDDDDCDGNNYKENTGDSANPSCILA